MRNFKLSVRLQTCADMVTKGSKVADVGTDHAYLPIWLIINDRVQFAISSDINDLPLFKAEENIKKYNVQDKIKLVKSDGLKNINSSDVDEIVIAGMGGELISKIISDAPWIKDERKRLILQPMSSECDLRIYLRDNKFDIEKERAVLSDGRIYTVISAVYSGLDREYACEYPYIGKVAEKMDAAGAEYIKRQIRDLLNRAQGANIRGDKNEYESKLCVIKRLRKIIESFGGN